MMGGWGDAQRRKAARLLASDGRIVSQVVGVGKADGKRFRRKIKELGM